MRQIFVQTNDVSFLEISQNMSLQRTIVYYRHPHDDTTIPPYSVSAIDLSLVLYKTLMPCSLVGAHNGDGIRPFIL